MVEASAPAVRELAPGDRPKDWIDGAADGNVDDDGTSTSTGTGTGTGTDAQPILLPLAAERYKVQFTATQEYIDLLETARDLLAHVVPSRSIEEVHLRAMRALVTDLKKRRTGATSATREAEGQANLDERGTSALPKPRQRGTSASATPSRPASSPPNNPRQRGRSVPRAVRRAVWKRDNDRCTYVDLNGQRCRETGGLELDHVQPHARGGPPTVANLRLRCRAHNALTAEDDFGRDFMAHRREAALQLSREN